MLNAAWRNCLTCSGSQWNNHFKLCFKFACSGTPTWAFSLAQFFAVALGGSSWAHIPCLLNVPNAKNLHWLWAFSQRWKAEKTFVLMSEQQLCQGRLRYDFLSSVWSINIYYRSAFPPLFFWRDWVCHLVLWVCIVHQNFPRCFSSSPPLYVQTNCA